MNCRPRWVALGVAALGAFPAAALASDAVQVRITSVKASLAGPSDQQLLILRPRFRRLVGYPSYRIMRNEERRCAWHRRQAFAIPGGRVLQVIPKHKRNGATLMKMLLLAGGHALIDTDVYLPRRGFMLFGVDRRGRADNGALLIMIRAGE